MEKLKTKQKRSTKSKENVIYDCDDVEKYLNKAITAVENRIMPRIKAIDAQNAEQLLLSKEHTVKHEEISKDHMMIKHDIFKLTERQERIYEDFIPMLKEGIAGILEKLDAHIEDENKSFEQITTGLRENKNRVNEIQETLNNVSANGNKGLSASLTDVYNKLHDIEKITEGARVRAKFWSVLNAVFETSPLLKPFKYKWGAILYIITIVLILNTIIHALGIEFDALGIVNWLLSFGKGA